MARAILLVAGLLWLTAAVAGAGLGLGGVGGLMSLMPPLAIGPDAVARTLIALAIASAIVGMAHLVIAGGMRRNRSWSFSAGILLTAGAAFAFVALAAAAVTSGMAGTLSGVAAIGSAIAAALVAAAYGTAAASMVHRLRSGGPD